MPEKFDNATLREEISDYLYANAVPTHYTIESMTDDIVGIFVMSLAPAQNHFLKVRAVFEIPALYICNSSGDGYLRHR